MLGRYAICAYAFALMCYIGAIIAVIAKGPNTWIVECIGIGCTIIGVVLNIIDIVLGNKRSKKR